MKASEIKFQPIIEGTKQYVVPLFQRAYSWDTKEWQVLWEDLIFLCENEEPKNHFIGSIVTMPTISVPEGVVKYLLIDGQQRLTTIFILLTLIRDLARQDGDQRLADRITQTMLVNPFNEDNDYYKLLPTQIDRNAFQKLLSGEIVEDSQIGKCYRSFERKLRTTTKYGVDLQILSKVITSRLSVVSIVLDYDDNAHLVFESLNAKGRPLTQADLIRNFFFMRIHVDQQDRVHAEYWKPMEVALDNSLTEFIRHYLMRDGAIVKQSDVYFVLKDSVNGSEALNKLQELVTYAEYYQRLLYPEYEENPAIRVRLMRLVRLEVTTAYPFLLKCYHDHYQGRLSAERFVDLLDILENYIIRRFVCGIPTNQLNKIFPALYRLATDQSENGDLVDGVRRALQSRGYPKDYEFRQRLLDTRLYGFGDRRIKTQLILEALEVSFNHKEKISFEGLTIEHVMPQTISNSAWWKHHLGDDWETTAEVYQHTLGNLTLTAYNSELSNDPFPDKQKLFATSHLELNRYFSGVQQWRVEEIERRAEYLADRAMQIWAYFGETPANVVSDDVTGTVPVSLQIMGQEFAVSTWREVIAKTFQTVASLEVERFEEFVATFSGTVTQDPKRFARTYTLDNGFYVNVNMNARSAYRLCRQAIQFIGLPEEEWVLKTRPY